MARRCESRHPCQVSVMLPEDVGAQLERACDSLDMIRLRLVLRVLLPGWELEREVLNSPAKNQKATARAKSGGAS